METTKITLATLAQAREYDVFAQIAKHLLTQNEKARVDGACVYRTPDGRACAAGCLISDEEYAAAEDRINDCNRFEQTNWGDVVHQGLAPPEHADLIREMQSLHDNLEPSQWLPVIKHIAFFKYPSTWNYISGSSS